MIYGIANGNIHKESSKNYTKYAIKVCKTHHITSKVKNITFYFTKSKILSFWTRSVYFFHYYTHNILEEK
jgi:hypothetical protein